MEISNEMRAYMTPAQAKIFESLSQDMQHQIISQFEREKVTKGQLFVWWLLFGAHYIKLKKIGTQIAFWFTAGGGLFWWLIDLFRLDKLAVTYNQDLIRKYL